MLKRCSAFSFLMCKYSLEEEEKKACKLQAMLVRNYDPPTYQLAHSVAEKIFLQNILQNICEHLFPVLADAWTTAEWSI